VAAKRIKWAESVPKTEIRYHVARFAIDESDNLIEAAVRIWAEPLGWPAPQITATVKFALAEHHRNQRLYLESVSGGRVPRRIKREIRKAEEEAKR
jgi:hypothetical protein